MMNPSLKKSLVIITWGLNKKTMTKTEKIAHLTKQLNEWTAMLNKSRKHSLQCMRATHVSYLQNELEKLKES